MVCLEASKRLLCTSCQLRAYHPYLYEFREERLDDFTDRVKSPLEQEKRELAEVARKPSRAEVREARMELGFSLPPWDEAIREERLDVEPDLPSRQFEPDSRDERSWA